MRRTTIDDQKDFTFGALDQTLQEFDEDISVDATLSFGSPPYQLSPCGRRCRLSNVSRPVRPDCDRAHKAAGRTGVGARPNVPQFACFDTAFHHNLPRLARLTALPHVLEREGIRRYGFHGLSYEYVLDELSRCDREQVQGERIVIAHLGNGASMAAIHDGRSVETTMGFSALGGLPMGTRCGDLDPGIVLHLLSKKDLAAKQVEHILYEESGLLGISGISSNMQDLLGRQKEARAAEAIAFFCYQARKHLGSLTAVLGGLDHLVFTGGIGANTPASMGAAEKGYAPLCDAPGAYVLEP
jgi:acetate kinase